MRSTLRTAALAAFLLLGAASAGQAQTPGQPQDDRRGRVPMAGEPRSQMMAQMQARREARERQRAQDLRTVLRLRPDQEPALSALVQSHRRPAPPRERAAAPQDAMTTPQRLDEMARHDAQRDALRQHHVEALRTFYTALSPEQRQVFDALQRMQDRGPQAGGGGHGGWGRRGFGGPPGRMGGPPPEGPPPRD